MCYVPAFNLDNYQTVDERLHQFWAENPRGRVLTELVSTTNDQFIVKAMVWRSTSYDKDNERPDSTGYAEERINASPVNRTSALENAETSAIGRALANLGYSTKGARPTREELEKVKRLDLNQALIAQATRELSEATSLEELQEVVQRLPKVLGKPELDKMAPLLIERRKQLTQKAGE